ncbi:hypothetical protein [Actinomadura sp. GTD37]|uniref:hypothetical protein n=1 Tax=Actinomadura sp. GTD37 TaxID=1778030 RepID=UPI0035BF4543
MTTEPPPMDPQLRESFIQGLRDAAGSLVAAYGGAEAARADDAGGPPGPESAGECHPMSLIVQQAELLANGGPAEFHQAAMRMSEPLCGMPHGAWTTLIAGCEIYRFSDQGRAPEWADGMRQWLGRPGPPAPYAAAGPAPDGPPAVPVSTPDPYPYDGSPAPQGWAGSAPDLIDHALHVGAYVGAAAAGGIIGNRADAGFAGAVKRTLRSVRARWRGLFGRSRRVPEDHAVEVARTEVVSRGYGEQTIMLLAAERESGCWIVTLSAVHATGTPDRLRVRIPFDSAAAPSVLVIDQGVP